jgi:ribosome-binding protein aMBF1 (putative translation factor)
VRLELRLAVNSDESSLPGKAQSRMDVAADAGVQTDDLAWSLGSGERSAAKEEDDKKRESFHDDNPGDEVAKSNAFNNRIVPEGMLTARILRRAAGDSVPVAELARVQFGTTPELWRVQLAVVRPRQQGQFDATSCRRSSVDIPSTGLNNHRMTDLFSNTFGIVVRKRREGSGLSQENLADLAGIHRTYVSSIELGKVRLGLDVAKKVADGLKLPLSELIAEAEREHHRRLKKREKP